MGGTEVKIGLEIHTYLRMENRSKLFCNCAISMTDSANTNICPRCTGQPGCKPLLPNIEAVEKIVKIGMILGCNINKEMSFQRKHYSWPDLPNGFQKTMSGSYSIPSAVNGNYLGIGITQIHLEEDPARWDPVTGKVDYNRSGHPLAEIVTEPDFKSADEVATWLKNLLVTLSYVKSIDKKAGIKTDVNVSVGPDFIRTEIKNVNSISEIKKAIEYEIERQKQEIADKPDEKLIQQTRMWDASLEKTHFMRSKENAMDYMFIPEVDLPIVKIQEDMISEIEKSIPEKPESRFERYASLGIDKVDAKVISNEIALSDLFDDVTSKIDPVTASRWFRRDIIGAINLSGKDIDELEIDSKQLITWFELLIDKKISPIIAKQVLEKLVIDNVDVLEYITKENLTMMSDESELDGLYMEAIEARPQAVSEYKSGKEKALNSIVGYVMSKTKGKANPEDVKEKIKQIIEQK